MVPMKLNLLPITLGLVLSTAFLTAPTTAFASFSPNFGNSFDNGSSGDTYLAQWLVTNGYYNNLAVAKTFAETGYIGHGVSDPDPYYWNLSQSVSMKIVQEVAAFADLNTFGYYTGSGTSKSLSQVFSSMQNGPTEVNINGPF